MHPNDIPSSNTNKMLLIGDSGAGKTGATLELANAGYTVRIADFDCKSAMIARNSGIVKPENLKNLDIIPFRGPKGKAREGYRMYKKALDSWEDKGALEDWDEDVVFVIDSMTFMNDSIMAGVKYMNPISKSGAQQHGVVWYGAGQDILRDELSRLTSPDVKCHVLILSHKDYLDNQIDDGDKVKVRTKVYPKGIGKKLSPHIGAYFNTMLEVRSRQIYTQPSSIIDTKIPILKINGLKDKYPVAGGLPEIFKLLEA